MVPLDHVETIDSNNTNSDNCHTTNTNISIVRFQDVADVNDPKGPATKPECTKLVYNLSREVAVYCCLSMGIGGVSDSYVLRDELRYSGSKVFDLVLMCKRRLVPLILSKRLKEEEREDYEKLYRIFVSCLEMLQVEFIRSMALQSMFPLWDTSTLLIQTGASESQSHKKSCHILETLDASGLDRKMMDHEEIVNLERKVMTLQELCYTTSQMMDVNPWDYKPDTDHTKIEVDTSDGERDGFEQSETRGGIHMTANRFDYIRAWKMNTRSPRYRKCIWITVFVVGTLVVVAGVIGLTFAFTKDDHPKD
ncbi:hypothetical protein BsWGS_04261 [Bradybaena similaris]